MATSSFAAALFLTTLAGCATAIGGAFALVFKPSRNFLGFVLAFSAGVMLYISFFDMLFDALKDSQLFGSLAFFAGMITFALIENFFPEHSPPKEKESNNAENTEKDNKLLSLGFMSMIGMCLHNFPEGIAIYISCLNGLEMGISLTFAIALHSFPEGMTVSAPIYVATNDKKKAFFLALIAGLFKPLGVLVFGLFFNNFLNQELMHILVAYVAGILVHITLFELLPMCFEHVSTKKTMIGFYFGIFISFGSLQLLNYLPSIIGIGNTPKEEL